MDQIMVLERITKMDNFLYVVGKPIYRVPSNRCLTVIGDNPVVSRIFRQDETHFIIVYTDDKRLVLNSKKVANVQMAPDSQAIPKLIQGMGYVPVPGTPPTQPVTKVDKKAVLTNLIHLKQIPTRYIVVDCEFGQFFKRKQTTTTITYTQTPQEENVFGVFQIGALGFGMEQSVVFNRYVNQRLFSEAVKLRGLRETGLTLEAYEQQSAPVTVVRDFIAQVLQKAVPLVFWDDRTDLKLLRNLAVGCFDQLAVEEQAVLMAPVQVFDAEGFTDNLIHDGRGKGDALLALATVAGLMRIKNPHPHHALWDAQTIQVVLKHLRGLAQQQPQVVAAPPVHAPQQVTTSHHQRWLHWLRTPKPRRHE